MDRASDSGSEGWGFESLLAYQKWETPFGVSHFCFIKGTRTISCRCPVDVCPAAAGRRRLLSVTSPFWRSGTDAPLGSPSGGAGCPERGSPERANVAVFCCHYLTAVPSQSACSADSSPKGRAKEYCRICPPKYNFSPWWIHPKGTGHIQSNIQIQQGKFSAVRGIFLRKRVEFPGCV